MDAPFREIDHSGDIGIEARGDSLAELVENVSRGLFGLMCHGKVGGEVTRRLSVTSASREDLIVDWLSDIIAAASASGEVYGDIKVEIVGEGPEGCSLTGVLRGERVTPGHDLRFDVKAATYHGLELREDARGIGVRVIFDL